MLLYTSCVLNDHSDLDWCTTILEEQYMQVAYIGLWTKNNSATLSYIKVPVVVKFVCSAMALGAEFGSEVNMLV